MVTTSLLLLPLHYTYTAACILFLSLVYGGGVGKIVVCFGGVDSTKTSEEMTAHTGTHTIVDSKVIRYFLKQTPTLVHVHTHK